MEDPHKKTEAASAAFSRIVAGDFLESLGKELGLEVPPDLPPATSKAGTLLPHEDVTQDFPSSAGLGGSAVCDSKNLNRVVDDRDRAQEVLLMTPSSQNVDNNTKLERVGRGDKKKKHELRSSSSEDERSRKRSRKHRRRHSSSDDDSSDDSRGRYSSRSRDDKKRSSRKKHRKRKHSRHK
ncbi:hypothetical protein SOVF_216970 [Spinacia oleracea]|nr:hypothetical protein SOVF_216970 [Spinacia oleracea]